MNRLKMPVWSFAVGLILLQMILVAIIVHGESLTFDEGDHIFAGYMMWHSGDYGLNPEHPPLVKLVATVPLLQEKLWVPPLQQRFFKAEAYRDGRDFMERNDGRSHRLLFRMGVPRVPILRTSWVERLDICRHGSKADAAVRAAPADQVLLRPEEDAR